MSEDDRRAMAGRFGEVCRRRGMKVNGDGVEWRGVIRVRGGEDGEG